MPSFWRHVNEVMKNSDLIIEVLDARMPAETRNWEVEDKIKRYNKKLLFVINKCDLIGKDAAAKLKQELQPCVFVSSTQRLGTTMLLKKILELSHGEKVVVGIVGYPNVGKSSIINALCGHGAAGTSSSSNFTKGVQKVRVNDKIILLDTPGVFPQKEKDEQKHGMTGALDFSKVKDAIGVALHIINEHKTLVCKAYDIKEDDAEEMLQTIGLKYGRLVHGGEVNEDSVARKILKDWQKGKIRKE